MALRINMTVIPNELSKDYVVGRIQIDKHRNGMRNRNSYLLMCVIAEIYIQPSSFRKCEAGCNPRLELISEFLAGVLIESELMDLSVDPLLYPAIKQVSNNLLYIKYRCCATGNEKSKQRPFLITDKSSCLCTIAVEQLIKQYCPLERYVIVNPDRRDCFLINLNARKTFFGVSSVKDANQLICWVLEFNLIYLFGNFDVMFHSMQ